MDRIAEPDGRRETRSAKKFPGRKLELGATSAATCSPCRGETPIRDIEIATSLPNVTLVPVPSVDPREMAIMDPEQL